MAPYAVTTPRLACHTSFALYKPAIFDCWLKCTRNAAVYYSGFHKDIWCLTHKAFWDKSNNNRVGDQIHCSVFLLVFIYTSFKLYHIVLCKTLSPRVDKCSNLDLSLLNIPWWRHQMETFSALLAICAGNSPVNSTYKGQWRGALMFSLICVWINDRVNNRESGDLGRHRAHHDVIVMHTFKHDNNICVSYITTVDLCIINMLTHGFSSRHLISRGNLHEF